MPIGQQKNITKLNKDFAMKKIIIGMTLITSLSAIASLNDLRREFKEDLQLNTVDQYIVGNFKSCLASMKALPQIKGACLSDIPKLLDMGLSEDQIKQLVVEVSEEQQDEETRVIERSETELRIENFINEKL